MIEIDKCILCNRKNFLTVTIRGMHFSGEKVLECFSCGMIFLSPRMTLSELEKFYSQNQFSMKFRGSSVPNESMVVAREQRALKKMGLIEQYLDYIPEGPILEIGCSSGYLLKNLRGKGHQVYGIDPSHGFVQYARDNYKLDVVSGMYPDAMPYAWGNRFAMVIALHVLEHADNPAYVLRSILDMLTKGGLLVLEVPDVNRAVNVRKYLHQEYFQKSHIWDFSSSTIKMLLEKSGFDVYICENYSSDPPDDKNVFLVAGNGGTKLSILEKSDHEQKEFARKLYQNLKFKLLLGRVRNIVRGFKHLKNWWRG